MNQKFWIFENSDAPIWRICLAVNDFMLTCCVIGALGFIAGVEVARKAVAMEAVEQRRAAEPPVAQPQGRRFVAPPSRPLRGEPNEAPEEESPRPAPRDLKGESTHERGPDE